MGAIAITEPTGGCDAVGGMRTCAIREGDEYVMRGEKRFITGGARADFLLLYAITDPKAPPHKGMSAFIFPTDTKGFEVVKVFDTMERRGALQSYLRFNDCRIPKECLLGEENQGYKILMHRLNAERTVAAAESLGVARSAFEIATLYAAEREQFKQPIRMFEGVSFKVTKMYGKIEAARLLTLRAARAIDTRMRATKEASLERHYAADISEEVCWMAMQILGGIGYTREYPVERYYRDARVGQITAGSTEVQRFIIQREIYRALGYK